MKTEILEITSYPANNDSEQKQNFIQLLKDFNLEIEFNNLYGITIEELQKGNFNFNILEAIDKLIELAEQYLNNDESYIFTKNYNLESGNYSITIIKIKLLSTRDFTKKQKIELLQKKIHDFKGSAERLINVWDEKFIKENINNFQLFYPYSELLSIINQLKKLK